MSIQKHRQRRRRSGKARIRPLIFKIVLVLGQLALCVLRFFMSLE